jgi:predicted AlkP superfamily phosphohydrolase/phosphomutase
MKILVLGLDCAAPELLLGYDDLHTIRHLMCIGCYGWVESVIPPITVPAWMCLATSQDPGSLGVYGFRNRTDHSYAGLAVTSSRSITEPAIWDCLAREGKRSIIVGVPPGYPPRRIHGLSVGCFLTPDTDNTVFTHPPELSDEIRCLVGHYPVDVHGFRTNNKAWLRDEIFAMSRTQFQVVRHLAQTKEWDYLHFVDIGLDRIHHGFWKYHDQQHILHEPDSPFRETLHDYYRHLDTEIGKVLELLPDDTMLLLVSDHGAQRLDGGFCVNEWLVREGLLVLKSYPKKITPFAQLDVDWKRTKVWSEGGYCARVFFNVKGREPQGTVEPRDYERVRDDIQARLEATVDREGKPLATQVFKPEAIYCKVRNVAPDLIVHFGGLYWRSIGGVGYPAIHVLENDSGPDDCNHSPFGVFILVASHSPIRGEVTGARLLDIVPTLLDLGNYDIPRSMQGRSLITGVSPLSPIDSDYASEDERIIRDRLSGLGYLG